MSKAVLLSIRPKWCEKIARGEKTIEVRKTRPKLETPFKAYIYCTMPDAKALHNILELHGADGKIRKANGKVIGEFACERIVPITYDGGGYERLRQLAEADKAGRAVILPCEPGTPVYMTFFGEVWEMRVGQFHVNGYTEPRIWADIDCDWASTQCVRWDLAVGKTVFLTREEAEKALEAMNNG